MKEYFDKEKEIILWRNKMIEISKHPLSAAYFLIKLWTTFLKFLILWIDLKFLNHVLATKSIHPFIFPCNKLSVCLVVCLSVSMLSTHKLSLWEKLWSYKLIYFSHKVLHGIGFPEFLFLISVFYRSLCLCSVFHFRYLSLFQKSYIKMKPLIADSYGIPCGQHKYG